MKPTICFFITNVLPGHRLIVALERDGSYSFRRDDEAKAVRGDFRDYHSTISAACEHYDVPAPKPATTTN